MGINAEEKGRNEGRNPTDDLAVPLLEHTVLSAYIQLVLVINLII